MARIVLKAQCEIESSDIHPDPVEAVRQLRSNNGEEAFERLTDAGTGNHGTNKFSVAVEAFNRETGALIPVDGDVSIDPRQAGIARQQRSEAREESRQQVESREAPPEGPGGLKSQKPEEAPKPGATSTTGTSTPPTNKPS